MAEKSGRITIIDELRGLAVVCMIVYHALFTVGNIFGLQQAQDIMNFFMPVEPIFAGLFIFISGICTKLSHSNQKRGLILAAVAIAISGVTIILLPNIGVYGCEIYFGVIHLLSFSIIIFSLLEKLLGKIPPFLGFVILAAAFVFTYNVPKGILGAFELSTEIPQSFYDIPVLFFLGLPGTSFVSADYFPIIPWFLLFLAGSYVGIWAKNGKFPAFMYKSCIVPLQWFGKNALIIYVLHQPVIYGIAWGIKRLITGE